MKEVTLLTVKAKCPGKWSEDGFLAEMTMNQDKRTASIGMCQIFLMVVALMLDSISNDKSRDLSGIFVGWALTLAGGLGAARLPVGSRGNARVRGPGELHRPKLDLSILHVPRQPLLRPFFLVFYFYISTVLVYSRNIF